MVLYACSKGMLVLDKIGVTFEEKVLTGVTASTKDKIRVWDTDDFTYEERTLGEVYELTKKDRKIFGALTDIEGDRFNLTICNRIALSSTGKDNNYDYYRYDNFWILYKNSKINGSDVSYCTCYLDKDKNLYLNNDFIMSDCYYISNPYETDKGLVVEARNIHEVKIVPIEEHLVKYNSEGVFIGLSFVLKNTNPSIYKVQNALDSDVSVCELEKNLIVR